MFVFFFQAEDGIRDLVRSRGLGDVYKRQTQKAAEKGVLMTIFDASTQEIAMQTAARLRQEGVQVILYPEADKLAKQLKYADRLGVRLALVIGPDEVAENTVVIKDLATRQQESVPMQALVERVKNLLA